jgi:hypothetical protein
VKFGVPVYYGARHLSQRVLKAAISEGVRRRMAADAAAGAEVAQPPPRRAPRRRAATEH